MALHIAYLDQKDSLITGIALAIPTAVLNNLTTRQFADDEFDIVLDHADYTNATVILVHGTHPPTQTNILQLCFAAHALKNAGARSIVGVIPYFGYGRHDKSDIPGKFGNAQIIARFQSSAPFLIINFTILILPLYAALTIVSFQL